MIVGSAEDFTIEVLTEIGGKIRMSAMDHVAIDDDHLAQAAKELPQLLFYYQAAFCRLNLRAAQAKIRLDEAKANAYIQHKAAASRAGEKIPADEVHAKVTLDPAVQAIVREHAELEAKADTIQGILHALRQKGYSLQLVASIRGKEEDWLRSSFADRFTDHPQREKIVQAFNGLIDRKIL
jgi:hypothetical protein